MRDIKILLVNMGSDFVKPNNPPLGLQYISSYLKHYTNDKIMGVDLAVHPEYMYWSNFCKIYNDFNPDLIGISCVTPTFNAAVHLASTIKLMSKVHIAIGGPHVSAIPEEAAKLGCFDSVIVGEGEELFLKIRSMVSKGVGRSEKIWGREEMVFNNIPFPDRDLFPISDYDLEINGVKAVNITSSRGCPFKCIYCNKSVCGLNFRQRSPENLVEEIKSLYPKIKGFYFVDDVFTLDGKTIASFCSQIINGKIKIVWKCMVRADCLSLGVLRKMKLAGCKEIALGVESGDSGILKKIKKGETKEDVRQAVRWIKEMGMRVRLFFMFGFPWDTERTLKNSINFAVDLKPDSVQFASVMPFPGTRLRSILEENKVEMSRNWNDYYLKRYNMKPVFKPYNLSMEQVSSYIELAEDSIGKGVFV